jgi:hypothetical protein
VESAAAVTPIQATAPKAPAIAAAFKGGHSWLELLEERIDDCMVAARGIDAEGFRDVSARLHLVRNLVVRKPGESRTGGDDRQGE